MRGGEYNESDPNNYDQNSPDNYNEMSPGGNPDSATSKLVNSRQSRKKAEEDVKLLANRIALLKMEEKKVRK